MKRCKPVRRGERGHVLTETALVFVPLMAMMLGIIDFGLAIFVRNTFQHAVREGVRYAVTYQTEPDQGHDGSIKAVVQRNAMGLLGGTAGAEKIIVRYYNPTTFALSAANAPGNIVEISVEGYTWGWIVPLLRSSTPLSIMARASDRMEGLAAGQTAPDR